MIMQQYNVAILGASGYTGGELIRILVNHPNVNISYVTAEKHAGKAVSEVFPHLKGIFELKLDKLETARRLFFGFLGVYPGAIEIDLEMAGTVTRPADCEYSPPTADGKELTFSPVTHHTVEAVLHRAGRHVAVCQ